MFKCDNCNQECTTIENLMEHWRKHHQENTIYYKVPEIIKYITKENEKPTKELVLDALCNRAKKP